MITADTTLKMCPQCDQWNTIDWWWRSESLNRWVCYSCGMGRREEQNVIDKKWEKQYGSVSST